MQDKNGNTINLGDILDSEYGYAVTVVEWEGIDYWVGQLICKPGHPCKDIPYDLNNGHDYIKRLPNKAHATDEYQPRVNGQ